MRVTMFPAYCEEVISKVTFCVIVTGVLGGDGEEGEAPLE
jgi:hypothetical protein